MTSCPRRLLLAFFALIFVVSCVYGQTVPPTQQQGVSILNPNNFARFFKAIPYTDTTGTTYASMFVASPPTLYRASMANFRSTGNSTPTVSYPLAILPGGVMDTVVLDNVRSRFITGVGSEVVIVDANSGLVTTTIDLTPINIQPSASIYCAKQSETYLVAATAQNQLVRVYQNSSATLAEVLTSTTTIKEPTVRLNPNVRYTNAFYDNTNNLGYFLYDDSISTTYVNTYTFPISTTKPVTSYSVSGILGSKASAYDPIRQVLYLCGASSAGLSVVKINVTNTPGSVVVPATSASLTVGGPTSDCNSLAIDTVNGIGFAGINSQSFGTLLRFTLATLTLVDQALVLSPSGPSETSTPADMVILTNISTTNSSKKNIEQVTQNQVLFVTTIDAISFGYEPACPGVPTLCSGNGFCSFSICTCNSGFIGADCSQIACSFSCGTPDQGQCSNGVCLCTARWNGTQCQTEQCPNNCNGNGMCSNAPNFTCACNFRYEGEACEIPKVLSCEDLNGLRSECLGRRVPNPRNNGTVPECGYCEKDNTCHQGNLEGPYIGECRDWYIKQKKEIGVVVLAIIFIVTLGIMFVINMISAVVSDVSAGKSGSKLSAEEVRRNWWRDERSNKAWMLYDQFQFMSYYIIVSVLFPTRLITFTAFFNWSNLALPIPFLYTDNKTRLYRLAEYTPPTPVPTFAPTVAPTFAPVARKLMSYGQYADSIGTGSEQVFYATMFWFAVLLVGFTILYVVFAVIIGAITGTIGKTLQRTVHVVIRIFMIGYMPILFTASYNTKSDFGPSLAGSIIAIVVIGFGLPVVAFLVVSKPEKAESLFEPDYKLKFGAFYAAFHYKKAKLCIVVFIKKFLVAIFLGFLAWDYLDFVWNNRNLVIPQIIIPVVILIAYIVFLIIVKPFLDHVHLYIEIGLTVINFVSLLIAFSHIKKPNDGGVIAVAVLQIIGLMLCIVAYINSWMMMVEAKSCKEITKICTSCC